MRKEISERQFGKLPPRALGKINVGKGGTGSTRFNELIVFAFDIGAEVNVEVSGKRSTVTGYPDHLKPVLDSFWISRHMGSVEGDVFTLG